MASPATDILAQILSRSGMMPPPAEAGTAPQAVPQAPGDPLDATIRQRILMAMNAKPTLRDRIGPLNVPWSNTQRPSAASYALRGLVAGFNGRLNGRAVQRSNDIDSLLRLAETRRYHDIQAGNMSTDNARADALQKEMAADRAQRQADRETDNKRLEMLAQSLMGDRSEDNQRAGRQLAEMLRHNQVMEGVALGNLAERRKEGASGGGRGEGSPKDISSPTSLYYESIGKRLKTAVAPGSPEEAAIDAWVAKQQETARANEIARRQGIGSDEAVIPPAPAAAPQKPNATFDILTRKKK